MGLGMAGRFGSGRVLRIAHAAAKSRVHRRRGDHAGAGDRRKHGDFHAGARGAVEVVAGGQTRAALQFRRKRQVLRDVRYAGEFHPVLDSPLRILARQLAGIRESGGVPSVPV